MSFFKYIWKNIIPKIFISTILWILYLEFNPKLGGIWIRYDSSGNKKIFLQNIFYFIIETLSCKQFWFFEFIDLNFFYITGINLIIFSIIENCILYYL